MVTTSDARHSGKVDGSGRLAARSMNAAISLCGSPFSEIGSKDLETEMLKKLSGNDIIYADRKYKDGLSFVNSSRLTSATVLSSNNSQ